MRGMPHHTDGCSAGTVPDLTVLQVDAKIKDDHNPVEHRERVIGRLAQRRHGLDVRATPQQRRRLAAISDWRTRLVIVGPAPRCCCCKIGRS